ncbi:tripartite motif-containing protein 59-like [Strongylocentrotus purpuratus]|uniref:RING-type domain-containing protein n=1 Tax=Strongylocentrotus purpuratus TaxID=7668 RepID=A0A7M7HEX9_STRPU|nr:tripartite motif-containing protein 59-like [Strongylocentrotus purpuratus]|eukprot:XP_011669621.1 PREDICTED: tripartite motif-containing protein 59-like [Strongylocentrotus purpuratus]
MADAFKNVTAQSLECPVCLDTFTDPKILSCYHTYCKACLDNLLECHGNEQMLRCPVCTAETQVPNQNVSKLPENLALKSLIEDVKNQHHHEVLALSEIKSGKVSVPRYRKFRKHPKEDEEYFCINCRRFSCFWCVVMEHKDDGHRIIEAAVYESSHMKSIEDLKSKADKKRSCFQKYVDFIDDQKERVSNV